MSFSNAIRTGALFILLSLCPLTAMAGPGGTGGGDWTESDLKHMLERLSQYVYSPEGQQLYPEVVAYDASNSTATLKMIFQELNPHIVNGRVFDQFGNERDCVSGNSKKLGRYFKCNGNNLQKKPDGKDQSANEKEFYGSMYRLCLHEAFVQAGLEKPVDKELPSVYPLASRLMVHLESFPEWVPGAATAVQNPVNTDPPELQLVLKRAQACVLFENQDIAKQIFGIDVMLQISRNTLLYNGEIGFEVDGQVKVPFKPTYDFYNGGHQTPVFLWFGARNEATMAGVTWVGPANGRDGSYCEEPAIKYALKTVNDGYDSYSNPINPRTILDKIWVENNTCPISTNLTLNAQSAIPAGEHFPQSISFNSQRYLGCLQQAIQGISP